MRVKFKTVGCLMLWGLTVVATADDVPWEHVTLPDTRQLHLEEPLHELMIRQLNAYAEAELQAVRRQRDADWLPTTERPAARSREAAIEQLRELIGAADNADTSAEIYTRTLTSAASGRVDAVRWNALTGVTGEGLVIHPNAAAQDAPVCIFLGDADQSPESLLGWTDPAPSEAAIVNLFALRGLPVYCPCITDRGTSHSGHPDIGWTNLSHREFVYRTSFELGHHVIGYDVQRVLALARGLKQERSQRPVLLVGVGEGGLLALYAAAITTDIDAVVVRGYFGSHPAVWSEPIDRNIWRGERYFGNAELAALIAPRPLWIDRSSAPGVPGPAPAVPGIRDIAAPGSITSPTLADGLGEFLKAQTYYERAAARDSIRLLEQEFGDLTPVELVDAVAEIVPIPKLSVTGSGVPPVPATMNVAETGRNRQREQVAELVRHSQLVLQRSDKVRDKVWHAADRSSLQNWERTSEDYRERLHRELIGQLPPALEEGNDPRSRKVIDTETHVGYEIMLNVYPHMAENPAQSFIAGGVLLLPKSLRPGERRPVVVCQHGLEGTPFDTITSDPDQRAFAAYKAFSAELAKRGFIVYAPQNPYKGYHEFRAIQRKSNPIGRSLFSYIIEQHRQTLHWLATLPYVDGDRIAFYGLSYGGKTAVRVPPLLVDRTDGANPRPLYCLSICSADYNEWIRKNSSSEDRYSYVFTPEYEIFEWNMGHLANYSELANLMAPRPFMVERGHHDGVAPDEWVAWEYAKVRRHYVQLGVGERTEIEWFNGPHTINGQGTYRFLNHHLNWPADQH